MQAQEIPEELLSRMVSMVDMMVETSLVSSAVLLEDTSRLDGFTEEDKGKFIDIPLEGGLLKIEVCMDSIYVHAYVYIGPVEGVAKLNTLLHQIKKEINTELYLY